jgi:hypothetical protein
MQKPLEGYHSLTHKWQRFSFNVNARKRNTCQMSFAKYDPNRIIYILRSLGPRAFVRLLISRLFSVNHYYLLGKNLLTPRERPLAINPEKSLTLITEDDIAYLSNNLDSFNPEDRREILTRLLFYENGFTNCYVIRHGDDIAYIQWIIFPAENQLITQKYSGRFYTLTSKQIMIENAFTFPRYRGRGYFLDGTQQLLELAKNNGYSSAICYIRNDRIMPLNEITQMGFRIIKMVSEYKLLGKAWRTL